MLLNFQAAKAQPQRMEESEDFTGPTSVSAPSAETPQCNFPNIQVSADTYVGGFVARFIKKVTQCVECLKNIVTETLEPHHLYTTCKEFDPTQMKLTYVKEKFATEVGDIVRGVTLKAMGNAYRANVYDELRSLLEEKHKLGHIGCSEHFDILQEKLKNFLIDLSCFWFSKETNRNLKRKKAQKRLERRLRKPSQGVRLVRRAKSVIRKSLLVNLPNASKIIKCKF